MGDCSLPLLDLSFSLLGSADPKSSRTVDSLLALPSPSSAAQHSRLRTSTDLPKEKPKVPPLQIDFAKLRSSREFLHFVDATSRLKV